MPSLILGRYIGINIYSLISYIAVPNPLTRNALDILLIFTSDSSISSQGLSAKVTLYPVLIYTSLSIAESNSLTRMWA